jgi:hypothetical protein
MSETLKNMSMAEFQQMMLDRRKNMLILLSQNYQETVSYYKIYELLDLHGFKVPKKNIDIFAVYDDLNQQFGMNWTWSAEFFYFVSESDALIFILKYSVD